MNTSLNVPPCQPFRGHVPQVKRFAVAHLHLEHLVEIAIKHLTHHADADGAAAHQALDRRRVEVVGEEFKVSVPLALLAQVFGEARDGLVRDREQLVEHDAELAI